MAHKMHIPGLEVKFDEQALAWLPTRHPGIEWIPLHVAVGHGPRDSAVLIRMAPGSGYPPHRHLDIEDVLILRGGYRDELGLHEAGEYVRYPAHSVHGPTATGDPSRPAGPQNPACLLFAVARGGVENLS